MSAEIIMKNKKILIALVAALSLGVAQAKNLPGRARDSMDVLKTVATLIPLDMKRVTQIAELLPPAPQGLGENYHNRTVWNKLYQDPAYTRVLEKAVLLLGKPFPAWDDEQYLMYFTKGTRTEGERMMSARSSWLIPLVWAECLENKGRFTGTIQMVLTELIHQKSWSLPAHDKTKQNIEGRYYTVDLGASVLAQNIAQALYLLDDKIPPSLRKEVLVQMNKHIFEPVLTSLRTGNNYHYWLTWTNNWNSVCLAGVTGAALALIPEPKERAKFVAIAERYSKNSIAGFTDEGYCTEGLGYYAYGFGHYILLRESVFKATNGHIDLFADPKIKRIAAYAPNLEIINDVYPYIADCHVGLKAPANILWYCSRTLGLGLTKYDTLSFKGQTADLIEDIMQVFPNSASESQIKAVNSSLSPGLRSYFKEAGVLVVRPLPGTRGKMGAALKGGNNNEIHNHNDVGSFSVVVGNEMLMGDPGGPFVYSAKTFGPERYTFKSIGSYGHPVPLVAGKDQQAGAAAQAVISKANFTDQRDEFTMDISSAYKVPNLTQLKRTFLYDRQDLSSLTVKDDFQFKAKANFEFALITRAGWRQTGPDSIEFDGEKEKMIAIIKTPKGFHIISEKIEENSPSFTRIGIVLDPSESGSITVTFKPITSL
ncbi:heparinase II/III family protein [Mucilaginibacter sp. PAMB04274]|uniref:heparinase II/III family protein n=1 Tax=Mucilaginibacter sp. PAMB04274 TaxID=3138568 RepID=UPI0031F69E97